MTPDFFGPVARDDLRQALVCIARDNKAATSAMLQITLQSARCIVERPMLGRMCPDLLPTPFRFWRVATFPYFIVYDASRRPPRVLRLLHMAHDVSPLLADLSDLTDESTE